METFNLKALKKLSGFFWASLSFLNGPFGKTYSFRLLAKQNMFREKHFSLKRYPLILVLFIVFVYKHTNDVSSMPQF